MKIDDTQLKQIGLWLILVLGAFGTPLLDELQKLDISLVWIGFLTITWYAIDYILAVVIYFYFKVKKEGTKWKIKSLYIGIGIGILVIIGAFGPVVIDWFALLGFSTILTIFLGIFYYSTEGLAIGFIIHYFKIPSEDVPITIPVLTEVTPESSNNTELLKGTINQ